MQTTMTVFPKSKGTSPKSDCFTWINQVDTRIVSLTGSGHYSLKSP